MIDRERGVRGWGRSPWVFVHIWHLAARFVTSLDPRPPSVETELWIDQHLTEGERKLWVRLSNQDRKHSSLVGQRFAQRRTGATRAEIAGAILHDVGKVDCGLGTFERSVATIVGRRNERYGRYFDHEEIGADLAQQAGSDPVTVELIAGHGPAYDDLEACDHA